VDAATAKTWDNISVSLSVKHLRVPRRALLTTRQRRIGQSTAVATRTLAHSLECLWCGRHCTTTQRTYVHHQTAQRLGARAHRNAYTHYDSRIPVYLPHSPRNSGANIAARSPLINLVSNKSCRRSSARKICRPRNISHRNLEGSKLETHWRRGEEGTKRPHAQLRRNRNPENLQSQTTHQGMRKTCLYCGTSSASTGTGVTTHTT
jgi:hypothetical protein